MKVAFVTGNKGKWEIAKDIFAKYEVDLVHANMETPEIQSLDVQDVALFSAQYAAQKLQIPVIKSDVGYYIPALNNFPGPFIKYVNQMLSSQDLLRLMEGKEDRLMIIRECLAFVHPNGMHQLFIHEQNTILAKQEDGNGSSIDKIMILDGFSKTKGASNPQEIAEHWKSTLQLYYDAAKFIREIDKR